MGEMSRFFILYIKRALLRPTFRKPTKPHGLGRGSVAHLIVGVGKGSGCTSDSWPWRKVEILVETQKGNSRPQNVFRATLKYAISSLRDKSSNLSKNLEILTNGKRRLGVRRYVDIQS